MIPSDSDDLRKEYNILIDELRKYNPELLDKRRVMAVTKSDLLDEELTDAMTPSLPDDLPVVFISSVSGAGIATLKDLLWRALTS